MTIAKNEILWLQFIREGEVVGLITSTPARDKYFLYEVKENKPVKTKHKSADPTTLEKYITEEQ